MRLHICKENTSKQNIAKPIFLNLVQLNVSQFYLVSHTKYTNKTHSLTCTHTHTHSHTHNPTPPHRLLCYSTSCVQKPTFRNTVIYNFQFIEIRKVSSYHLKGYRTVPITFSIFFTTSDYILYPICMLNKSLILKPVDIQSRYCFLQKHDHPHTLGNHMKQTCTCVHATFPYP